MIGRIKRRPELRKKLRFVHFKENVPELLFFGISIIKDFVVLGKSGQHNVCKFLFLKKTRKLINKGLINKCIFFRLKFLYLLNGRLERPAPLGMYLFSLRISESHII